MHPDAFRSIALARSETVESRHAVRRDFRVSGKIFATLGYPDSGFGMMKLPLELQEQCMRLQRKAFSPAHGAWARQGNTFVNQRSVDCAIMREAMVDAWRHVAPAKLHDQLKIEHGKHTA